MFSNKRQQFPAGCKQTCALPMEKVQGFALVTPLLERLAAAIVDTIEFPITKDNSRLLAILNGRESFSSLQKKWQNII